MTQKWENENIGQISLPLPSDSDRHPRLLLDGYGIHAGDFFTALLPGGWQEIRLEVCWEREGAACWYIAAPPELADVCPVGLFVKL